MTKYISLKVNDVDIKLDYFVQAFVDHTVRGMLESLEDTESVRELDLTLEGDTIGIQLNSKHISTNNFVNKIMKSTLSGMVAPLKGVSSEVRSMRVQIKQ
jgi:hypothetical protein